MRIDECGDGGKEGGSESCICAGWLKTPVFSEGVEMSIFLLKTWHSEFFLLKDEIRYIKNEVDKIPIDFSTA
ncbi:hypothetical protein [Paenibacillus dendritiformis]|uniref:hypothetical protein n=1 Tax=Paenibacillus dendritiformis TaxID=130049 RepID=UPI001110F684|nr:hypothetical protein [Paenibacillus dendritiformis]CAH8771066.1 hypothetical protein H7S4_003801 [Paenibacillus dendritiformis]